MFNSSIKVLFVLMSGDRERERLIVWLWRWTTLIKILVKIIVGRKETRISAMLSKINRKERDRRKTDVPGESVPTEEGKNNNWNIRKTENCWWCWETNPGPQPLFATTPAQHQSIIPSKDTDSPMMGVCNITLGAAWMYSNLNTAKMLVYKIELSAYELHFV